jgi:hypothetical protein
VQESTGLVTLLFGTALFHLCVQATGGSPLAIGDGITGSLIVLVTRGFATLIGGRLGSLGTVGRAVIVAPGRLGKHGSHGQLEKNKNEQNLHCVNLIVCILSIDYWVDGSMQYNEKKVEASIAFPIYMNVESRNFLQNTAR